MIETAKTIISVIENATRTFSKAKQLLDTPEALQSMDLKLEQLGSEFELIRQSEERIAETIRAIDKWNPSWNVEQQGNGNTVQQGKNVSIGNHVSGWGGVTVGNISF